MKTSPSPMLQLLLPEDTCDTLTKMLFGYVMNMPHTEKFYNEKLMVVVEFAEQVLPAHPGAFAAYFQLLDKLPATVVRKVPEEMLAFVEENVAEIEKYYTQELPSKYRMKKIITPDKTLVDATGNPLDGSGEKPKLILV